MHIGLLIAFALAACSPPRASTQPTSLKEGAVIEKIEETAVGNLNGVDVPMANVTNNYKFMLPDGTEGRGKACLLILPDNDVWVGIGSEVSVGGATWRVTHIDSPKDETGSVTLQQLGQ
jgi:hypothetical protein